MGSSSAMLMLKLLSRSLLLASAQATLRGPPIGNDNAFDYVIVGGGTAGLVIANRLSADPSLSVAVIEAGYTQISNPNVTTPNTFGLGLGTQIDWAYPSAPQVFASGQSVLYDQGKGLGGTSLINGQTYIRAAVPQIDGWQDVFGSEGWTWANLFPYYLKSETFQVPDAAQADAGCSYDATVHGESGPLEVGWFEEIAPATTYHEVRTAWEQTGVTWIQDVNTGNSTGASTWPLTVSRTQDIRWDAAQAYLYGNGVADRTNLQVFQNTTAQKIVWGDDVDGEALACGVEVSDPTGMVTSIVANKEVIVSAGSIKSPVLLEASGVGNAEVLTANNIAMKVDLPSVGFNLQDQAQSSFAYSAGGGGNFTGYPIYVSFATAQDLFGDNVTNVEDYVRSQIPTYAQAITSYAATNATTPEIQEKLLSGQADLIFKDLIPVSESLTAPFTTVIANPTWGLLPFSRGSVHINGSSVDNTPIIDPAFFLVDWDTILLTGVSRQARRFLAHAVDAGWAGTELAPSFANVSANATDEEWFEHFQQSFNPNYHPVGSCARMAKELGGVVDEKHIVYGTKNVRVVDASTFPAQVDGHLTSTIYAMAERVADIMLGKC